MLWPKQTARFLRPLSGPKIPKVSSSFELTLAIPWRSREAKSLRGFLTAVPNSRSESVLACRLSSLLSLQPTPFGHLDTLEVAGLCSGTQLLAAYPPSTSSIPGADTGSSTPFSVLNKRLPGDKLLEKAI